jgi:hypothetical protein
MCWTKRPKEATMQAATVIITSLVIFFLVACGDGTNISPVPPAPAEPNPTTTTVEVLPEGTMCRGPECCGHAGSQWDSGLGRCVNGWVYELPRLEFISWRDEYTPGWSGAITALQIETKTSPLTVNTITIETLWGPSNMPFRNIFAAQLDGRVVSDEAYPNPGRSVEIHLDYSVPSRQSAMIYIMADIIDPMIRSEFVFHITMEGTLTDRTGVRPIIATSDLEITIR